MKRRRTGTVFLALIVWQGLCAQEKRFFFFRDLPYGSEAVYNPLTLLLNGGGDILQTYQSPNRFDELPWKLGATSVWRSITSPFHYVDQYGWGRFLSQEVFPTSLNVEKAQWIPNLFLHTIGGGMEFRKVSEWYDYHGYPVPYILGAFTAMSYHYLNELIENGDGIHPNTDAIADLLIFDPLGIVLFSSDAVSEFFAVNLSFNDWSNQPAFSFRPFSMRNVGQAFVMKYPVSESKRTNIFFHFGKFALLGLSLKTHTDESVSFGCGATTTGIYTVDERNGIPTKSTLIGAMAGVYYDRNNSLLASLTVTDTFIERFKLNVYPGVLFSSQFSPGIFLALEQGGTFGVGVSLPLLPIGVSAYQPR